MRARAAARSSNAAAPLLRTVDLGPGCWSMHSIRETVGVADVDNSFVLFHTFFSSFAELDRKCSFRTQGVCPQCPP